MAGTRTLKLSILADVDNLRSQLNKADDEVQGFGKKLGDFGKMAGAAFAAAGVAAAAYATKLAIDGVKAAIEDEAAQKKLALTLKNVTGATNSQVASMESWISAQGIAYGFTDDQLRPAIERLTRSTKSLTDAETLAQLAMDISANTGKDLTTVANALAKANDGQTGALKKLGITLGENATNYQLLIGFNKQLEKAQREAQTALEEYGPKSKEYAKALEKVSTAQEKVTATTREGIDWQGELTKEFSGAAAIAADTYQGKLARLKLAFDEGKETVGSYILTAITPLVEGLVQNLIPALSSTSNTIGKNLGPVFKEFGTYASSIFKPLLEGLKSAWNSISKAVGDNKEELAALGSAVKTVAGIIGPLIGTTLKTAFELMGKAIAGVITAVSTLVDWFKKLWDWGGKVKDFLTFGGGGSQKASFTSASIRTTSGGGTYTGYTGGDTPGYTVRPEWDVPTAGGADRILTLAEALASPGLAGTLAANAASQGLSVSDYYASRGGVYAGTGYYGDAPTVLTQDQFFGSYAAGGADALNALSEKLQGTNQVTINITGAVVDPQGVARAVEDAFTTTANATGSFTSLGRATTSLASA